jgi:voltage-gated potassium channel
MFQKIKIRLYDILVETEDNDLVERIVAIFLMILIVLNSVAVVLETVEELNARYSSIFNALEMVSVTVFTVEYLLRLWIAPLNPRYSQPFWGRVKYAFSLMALIDLLAILPTFLPLIFPIDLRIMRFLRIFRLFRLFKMSRYVESLNTLDDVVRSRKEQLGVTFIMILMLLLMSSSLMYLVETKPSPTSFRIFRRQCGGAWRP